MRLHRLQLVALAVVVASASSVIAGPFPTGYAVFGNGDVSLNDNVSGGLVGTNHDVTAGSFLTLDGVAAGGSFLNSLGGTTINGPVTVNGNVQTGGNTYNGPINAGGSVNLGAFFKTQGIVAAGDVTLGGVSSVTGNVLSGGNVANNGSAIAGNVTANGTISNSAGGKISGTQTPHAGVAVNPAKFTPVTLPAAASFTVGTTNVSGTATLAPGKYGAVEITAFNTLTLSAGNYYFKSLQFDGSGNLHLDLSKGPINVYVQGDITGTDFFTPSVKAPGSSTFTSVLDSNNKPNAAVEALAADVFFETLGNVNNGSPFGANRFGTVYAPDGNITDAGTVVGSLVAGGTVNLDFAFQTVYYVPLAPVPEPSGIALSGLAGAAVAWRARRRR